MTHLANQLELFRGQIEELQGKMQQSLAQLEGPQGAFDVLRGRTLEMRGKARQAVVRARMGAEDLSTTVQKHPESVAPYAGVLVLGVAIAAVATFWPHLLTRAWEWVQRSTTYRTTQPRA